ncbi:fibril-forming collagen alpha chain-like [Dryobates pubescens]|uniref:fibril-forming collagen alpha chain-like n=1 Tax=Dryobates pubescens TaxID=118200 RepID=UPI0023B99D82|nr:fibril-forming collagen alpha chain-like [Dryobates pubescens]
MAMGHKRGQPGETPTNSQKPPPGFRAPRAGKNDSPALPGARGRLDRTALGDTGTPGKAEVTAASHPPLQPLFQRHAAGSTGAGAGLAVSGVTGNRGKLAGTRRHPPLRWGKGGRRLAGLRFSDRKRGRRAARSRAQPLCFPPRRPVAPAASAVLVPEPNMAAAVKVFDSHEGKNGGTRGPGAGASTRSHRDEGHRRATVR